MNNTIVIYYSWSGSTRRLAEELARERQADLYEIKDQQRPGTLKAYTAGCAAAMGMKPWPIQPVNQSFERYENIILMAPIWAGSPAPAFNHVYSLLPEGRAVEVRVVAASGSSRCEEKIAAALKKHGCTLAAFQTVKPPKNDKK